MNKHFLSRLTPILLVVAFGPVLARAQDAGEPAYQGKPLSVWLEALKDKDRDTRRAAAATLAKVGPEAKAAVSALTDALADKDRYVRANAARALAGIGPGAVLALPTLKDKLKDRDTQVRVQVAYALWAIDRQAKVAVPVLVQALGHDDENVRTQAVEVLGAIGPRASGAVPDLTKALRDEEASVRGAANTRTSTFEVSAVTRATEPLPEVPYHEAVDHLLNQPLRLKKQRLRQEIELSERLGTDTFDGAAELQTSCKRQLAVVEATAGGRMEACSRYHGRLVAGCWSIRLWPPCDDFIKGSPENPWGEVIDEFSTRIREHVGRVHDLFVPRFSTTGPTERIAAEIVLLDAVQSYFEYVCGPCVASPPSPSKARQGIGRNSPTGPGRLPSSTSNGG